MRITSGQNINVCTAFWLTPCSKSRVSPRGTLAARLALADALYGDGELELALVAYWRGLQLRPGLEALQQGTRRCEESIVKAIGKGETLGVGTEGLRGGCG